MEIGSINMCNFDQRWRVWFGLALVSWKSIEIMTVITIDDHYGEGDQDFTYMGLLLLNLIII